MRIKKTIEVFEKILKEVQNNNSFFICHEAKRLYGKVVAKKLQQLFSSSGYYRNYMVGIILRTRCVCGSIEFGDFKRNFLKTEIKELTALLKQGYTDI
jgi:uncharacterized membrane protein YjjP (DUF1212 family)